MFTRKRQIVGLDFNDYYAEVVELELGKADLSANSYGRTVIPSEVIVDGQVIHVDQLQEILKDLLKHSLPTPIKPQDVAIVLPSNKVLTHIFRMPATLSKKEIAGALPYEIEKIIPFPIDEIYYDFDVLYTEDTKKFNAKQNVLFAAVEKTVADNYVSILRSLQMNPVFFAVVPEILKFALNKQLIVNETVMVVEVDTLSTNYLLVEKGIIKHFFSSNNGGRRLIGNLAKTAGTTEDEIIKSKGDGGFSDPSLKQVVNEFYTEVYKRGTSIVNDAVQDGLIKGIDRVLATGKFLDVCESHELLTEHFREYKFEIGDPKLGIAINSDMSSNLEQNSSAAIPYSIFFTHAIGSAVTSFKVEDPVGINLIPGNLKKVFKDKRLIFKMAWISVIMSILSVVMAAWLGYEFQNLIFVRSGLEISKSSTEKLLFGVRYQEIRDEIIEFNKEVTALSAIDEKLFSLPTLLRDIQNFVPKNVEITSVEFTDSNLGVRIDGVAQNRDDLLEMQKNLQEADFVESLIAPISNFDEKQEISFLFQLKLNFSKLSR